MGKLAVIHLVFTCDPDVSDLVRVSCVDELRCDIIDGLAVQLDEIDAGEVCPLARFY